MFFKGFWAALGILTALFLFKVIHEYLGEPLSKMIHDFLDALKEYL